MSAFSFSPVLISSFLRAGDNDSDDESPHESSEGSLSSDEDPIPSLVPKDIDAANSDDKSAVSLLSTMARMDNNGDVDADLRMMLVGFDLAYQFEHGLDVSGMDISSVADTGFSLKHAGAALVVQKPIASAAAALKSAVDNGTSPGVRSSLAGGPKR